jgi:hypothetical protein
MPSSVVDSRNSGDGNFPNDSRSVQGTVTYDTPDVDSRSTPGIFEISSCGTAAAGNTAYTGVFTPALLPTGAHADIVGFNTAANNGSFAIVSCTGVTLTVANANGVAETPAGDATVTVDSRASGAPVDCRTAANIPVNSRT